MKAISALALFLCLLTVAAARPAAAGEGAIQGRVELKDESGTVRPGMFLKIFLTREKIPTGPHESLADKKKPEAIDAIISLHVDFYKNLLEKRAMKDFMAGDAESRADGTFLFERVAPGDYHIVIAFPSMIRTRKVAWQVPVHVKSGKTAHVTLNGGNMALPTYRR
ncbi:exported hypothetical protein [Candidatus Desulfarcum epimagneticum]|uniref:Carboxypeptidase regulatory-like domain-containing protein n=1 Tax=uncultured Desulfobacteraceae bacterium TaxID=218296 RepID=A0A484HDP5_9BACT|nr:exported hypothetical protein [uncultured Desulfobacteraceae bacterium]